MRDRKGAIHAIATLFRAHQHCCCERRLECGTHRKALFAIEAKEQFSFGIHQSDAQAPANRFLDLTWIRHCHRFGGLL